MARTSLRLSCPIIRPFAAVAALIPSNGTISVKGELRVISDHDLGSALEVFGRSVVAIPAFAT